MRERRDEFPTVRITNLSEDTSEQDVKDLVSRFGHTARVVSEIMMCTHRRQILKMS